MPLQALLKRSKSFGSFRSLGCGHMGKLNKAKSVRAGIPRGGHCSFYSTNAQEKSGQQNADLPQSRLRKPKVITHTFIPQRGQGASIGAPAYWTGFVTFSNRIIKPRPFLLFIYIFPFAKPWPIINAFLSLFLIGGQYEILQTPAVWDRFLYPGYDVPGSRSPRQRKRNR